MHRSPAESTWGAEAPRGWPRLFVAVPLPERARSEVEQLVDEVRREIDADASDNRSPVRWVRMDGLHLTLRFLGPTPPERVAALHQLVDEVAATASRFEVTISGGGAFPSPQRPRTLWLAVARGGEALAELTARLDDGLVAAGWPIDRRPFRPHLTVARADGRREGPAVARLLEAHATRLATSFVADRLVLFESVTGGGPARYVPRHEAPLRPAD